MTCANKKCPAPTVHPESLKLLSPPDNLNLTSLPVSVQNVSILANTSMDSMSTFPSWPMQLACMNVKCGFKIFNLLLDKDIQAVGTCFAPAVESCGETLWTCLGDEKCRSTVQCWANGTEQEASDVWKMVTDQHERTFIELLFNCVEGCSGETNPLNKAVCASKCGLKSAKCVTDSTCRHAFDDLPLMATKCGVEALEDVKFKDAAKCIGHMAADCGRAG